MKKWSFYAMSLFMALAFSSCSEETANNEKKAVSNEKAVDKEVLCLYDYDHSKTTLTWEAYKTTEKIGVKGQLKNISMSIAGKGTETIDELFSGSIFKVMTNSVDSDNQERDDKIRNFFFGNLNDGEIFNGSVKSVNGDNTSGIMYVNLTISRVTKDVKFDYTVDAEGNLEALSEIDMNDFNGQPAIESLNDKCDELHKGADGVSKLWPNVNIKINTKLRKDCQ